MKTCLPISLTALLVCTLSVSLLSPLSSARAASPMQRVSSVSGGHLSDWMSSADYQRYCEQHIRAGYYPSAVEGRSFQGRNEYRGFYTIWDESFAWESRHGLTGERYATEDKQLRERGYVRICMQSFTDDVGITRYQATWIRPAH